MARRDSIAEARTQGTTFSTVPRKIDAALAHPSGSIVQDLFSITPPDGEGQGACKTRAFYIKGRLVQKSVSSKQFAELVDVPFENRSRSGALCGSVVLHNLVPRGAFNVHAAANFRHYENTPTSAAKINFSLETAEPAIAEGGTAGVALAACKVAP